MKNVVFCSICVVSSLAHYLILKINGICSSKISCISKLEIISVQKSLRVVLSATLKPNRWSFRQTGDINRGLTTTEVRELLQGPSLQSEHCGEGTESWGCLLSPSSSLPADHPGVVAEVGPGCRCGCVVHLGVAKPRRILATSTASCPGRTFWLIQASPLMQPATQLCSTSKQHRFRTHENSSALLGTKSC